MHNNLINLDLTAPTVHDKPCRHIIFENVLNFSEASLARWISKIPKSNYLTKFSDEYQKYELRTAPNGPIGDLLKAVNSRPMLDLAQAVFGCGPLAADESFDGGGLVLSGVGASLKKHIDFPWSDIAKGYRIVNCLLYLSSEDIQGGDLHLYDQGSQSNSVTIGPKFGRLVMFATSKYTPHGFTKITKGVRRSINAYYYSKTPLDDRVSPTKTVWLD